MVRRRGVEVDSDVLCRGSSRRPWFPFSESGPDILASVSGLPAGSKVRVALHGTTCCAGSSSSWVADSRLGILDAPSSARLGRETSPMALISPRPPDGQCGSSGCSTTYQGALRGHCSGSRVRWPSPRCSRRFVQRRQPFSGTISAQRQQTWELMKKSRDRERLPVRPSSPSSIATRKKLGRSCRPPVTL